VADAPQPNVKLNLRRLQKLQVGQHFINTHLGVLLLEPNVRCL
jgi:hypothetical protein